MALLDQPCECPQCGGAIAKEDAPRRRCPAPEVIEVGYIHCKFCGKIWEWKRLPGFTIRANSWDDLKSPVSFRRAMRRMERARAA